MQRAKALYDYIAQDDDKLSFKEDDVIEVTQKRNHWSKGVLKGKTGQFSSNYVEFLGKAPPANKSKS